MSLLPDGAGSIFVVATRVSVLDSSGFVDPGAATYTTNTALKIDANPVMETGDDVAIKNAAGDLAVWAKHPDMIKYATMQLELATPDPSLEQVCAGGVVFTDVTVALGAPGAPTVTPQTTLGTLTAGTYGYRVTQYNQYGESTATADVSAVTTGSTGLIVISGSTLGASAIGARVYGRTIGGEQLIGSYPNLGAQATSAASGTGTVTSLAVTALTASIPLGTTFTIAGDTNAPKIVFTTTSFAPKGAVTVPVSASQSVTTTIAPAAIVPCFVDSGAITPSGFVPQSDTTAGPGVAGYQAPALGVVGNPNGVSIECWSKAILAGFQVPTLPYWHWVFPRITGMHITQRALNNGNTATLLEGQSYGNPNWGTGPQGDWNFDSTKWYQRRRCGAQVVPVASSAPVAVAANV